MIAEFVGFFIGGMISYWLGTRTGYDNGFREGIQYCTKGIEQYAFEKGWNSAFEKCADALTMESTQLIAEICNREGLSVIEHQKMSERFHAIVERHRLKAEVPAHLVQ